MATPISLTAKPVTINKAKAQTALLSSLRLLILISLVLIRFSNF
jgi:hypothetical protein